MIKMNQKDVGSRYISALYDYDFYLASSVSVLQGKDEKNSLKQSQGLNQKIK